MNKMNTTPTPTSNRHLVVENYSRDTVFEGSFAECEAWLDKFCKGYRNPTRVRSRFFIYEVKNS